MASLKLRPPKLIQAEVDALNIRNEILLKDRILKLENGKMEELEKQIKRHIQYYKDHTGRLQEMLRINNDLLEGVVEEVAFPFRDASNVDPKLAIGSARTFRSAVNRAVFPDPERLFVAQVDDSRLKDRSNKVEDAFNYKAYHDNGLFDCLKDGIVPTFRDGTYFVSGFWHTKVERVFDYKRYVAPEDFRADYPEPEDANVSAKEYGEIVRYLAKPNAELEVCFEYDFPVYDDIKWHGVPLANFIMYPLWSPTMSQLKLYGYRVMESELDIKVKQKVGEYIKDAADDILQGGRSTQFDSWTASRDYVEGISAGEDTDDKRFENYRLAIRLDLDDDGIPEMYLAVFNFDKGKFLRIERYPLRRNVDFLIPLRFVARDGRILGASLLDNGADVFTEIRDIHRHRNNKRMITDGPILLVDDTLKDKMDFGASNNVFRPGITLYLPPNKMPGPSGSGGVQQLNIQGANQHQDSIDEENLLVRYSEFIIGPTMGLSGQETPNDPRSPATKHLSQIRQAGFRLDDYIDEFKRPFPKIGQLGCTLYYQFGPRQLKYTKTVDGSLQRQDLDVGLFAMDGMNLHLNATSVTMSPAFEQENIQVLAQAAGVFGVAQIKPEIVIHLWNRFVTASRLQNADPLKIEMGGEVQDDSEDPVSLPGQQDAMNELTTLIDGANVPGKDMNEAALAVSRGLVSPEEAAQRLIQSRQAKAAQAMVPEQPQMPL